MISSEPPQTGSIEIDGPLVSASEIAELFGVHPSTIRRLAREGRIPRYLIGSTPRFVVEEVAAYFRKEAMASSTAPRSTARTTSGGEPIRPLQRARLRSELFG